MKILIIIAIVLLLLFITMLSYGIYLYFKIFRKMSIEFKEFIFVTFNSLKDSKVSDEERTQILKEFCDLSPYAKQVKDKFYSNYKLLESEIETESKYLYTTIKEKNKKNG